MIPTRRSKVIHLLQRQAQLQRDQMADEQVHLVEKHSQASEGLEKLNQEQVLAHGHLRKFVSRGTEINPDIYRSVALAGVERMEKIATAASDVDAAERDVEAMRLKLFQHEEKIKKLDEIGTRERDLQHKKEAIVEFNANDALWLSRRGVKNQ